MWKNIVERCRPQMSVWRMRLACWIPKATNTHTHTHTQNMLYSLLFLYNNGCTNAPHCCIIRAYPVLFLPISDTKSFFKQTHFVVLQVVLGSSSEVFTVTECIRAKQPATWRDAVLSTKHTATSVERADSTSVFRRPWTRTVRNK